MVNSGMSFKKEFSRKEASREIEKGLSEGKSKQELLQKLKEKFFDKDTIAKVLANFADPELRVKYRGFNRILLMALVLTGVFGLIAETVIICTAPKFALHAEIIFPLLFIIFAVEVRECRGFIYRFLRGFAILSLFHPLVAIFRVNPSFAQVYKYMWWILPNTILTALIIGLALYTGNKMFPNYGWFGPKKNKGGRYIL